MSAERASKRRRTARACDSCRGLKAKCDGQQPVCGRCSGYGFTCLWTKITTKTDRSESPQIRLKLLTARDEIQKLRLAIGKYDSLLKGLRNKLSENDRKVVELSLTAIQLPVLLPESAETRTIRLTRPRSTLAEEDPPSIHPHRYLGEASDIRFCNSVRKELTTNSTFEQQEEGGSTGEVDSYEQDDAPGQAISDDEAALLPPRLTADKFLDIYFSTIHIAYPFVWEPAFRRKYQEFWKADSLESLGGPWLSLLLTIFAIGACYEAFAGSSDPCYKSDTHHVWFEQAVAISQSHEKEGGIDNICAQLAQCFYFLTTCQTNRCWMSLGQAIRSAQSIGLHTEDVQRPLSSNDIDRISIPETRKRLWYSVYVLDRLLSLQLGRPPAIHDGDFMVGYPSKLSDVSLSSVSHGLGDHSDSYTASCIGEYFIAMIQFSGIIGRVFSLLYGPSRTENATVALSTIESLDKELLQWRACLPRILRFDLPHTFENSSTFKRQRNMLAIKFYNLQALIHRPLLSPSRLFKSCTDPIVFYQTERTRIVRSKKKCVSAAQNTARLLHDVPDKKQLIYGFPWWQMISCLICASSILLVARLFMGQDEEDEVEGTDWLTVDEDADVCLTVFGELSSNSNAARLAQKMMQGLKETRLHPQNRASPSSKESGMHGNRNTVLAQNPSATSLPSSFPVGLATSSYDPMLQEFPFDLTEPVIWSSQFVNAAYNPFLGQPDQDFEGSWNLSHR